MALELRPAKLSDLPSIIEVYFAAFRDDAVHQICFPKKPSIHKFWTDFITDEMTNDPHSHWIVVIDTSAPNSPIIAFAKWSAPQENKRHSLPNPWPIDTDPDFANMFFGQLEDQKMQVMGDRPHWYLMLIGTSPEYQGKGAAGKLIRYGLEKADEQGVEAYLEASPEGVPIYSHFGFKEVDRLSVLDGKFVELFMLRGVRPKD